MTDPISGKGRIRVIHEGFEVTVCLDGVYYLESEFDMTDPGSVVDFALEIGAEIEVRKLGALERLRSFLVDLPVVHPLGLLVPVKNPRLPDTEPGV